MMKKNIEVLQKKAKKKDNGIELKEKKQIITELQPLLKIGMKKIKPTKQKEKLESLKQSSEKMKLENGSEEILKIKLQKQGTGSNTYKATESDQYFALKRVYTILDGHYNDKFSNPILCNAIWELHEQSLKFLRKYMEDKKLKDSEIEEE